MVKILYFMKLAELLGRTQEEVALPLEITDVAGLLAWLGQRDGNFKTALGDGRSLQVTVNKKFVETAAVFGEGDEIAFFPKSR